MRPGNPTGRRPLPGLDPGGVPGSCVTHVSLRRWLAVSLQRRRSLRLALVLASAGEKDEAGSLAEEARSVTPASCLPVCALTVAASARSLPIATEAALAMAEEAIALTPDSMPNQKADLLVELARVQEAAGLEDESLSSPESAMNLYERKGNVAAVRLLERGPPGQRGGRTTG